MKAQEFQKPHAVAEKAASKPTEVKMEEQESQKSHAAPHPRKRIVYMAITMGKSIQTKITYSARKAKRLQIKTHPCRMIPNLFLQI